MPMTRDSNLYRLPDGIDASELVAQLRCNPRRRGEPNVCSRGCRLGDRDCRSFALNATLDDNRYADNDSLDNTSGNGRLDWNWRMGRDWTGQLGGGYGRSLSGFVNSRFLGRDVLESADYHGAASLSTHPALELECKSAAR